MVRDGHAFYVRLMRIAALVFIVACHRESTVASTTAPSASAVAIAPASASASAAPVPDDPHRALLRAWNDAHVAHDAAALSPLYGDSVRFYGARLSRAQCVSRLATAMKRAPDEKQSVKDVLVRGDSISFTKTIVSRGKTADYRAYLQVEHSDGGAYVIVEESDAVTDANLATCVTVQWTGAEDEERSATVTGLTGSMACGFVNHAIVGDVPPSEGDFCLIMLDKPICLLSGMSVFENENRMTNSIDANGDPHEVDKAYGGKRVVVNGTVYTPHTGHHHASVAMGSLDALVVR